MDQAPGVTDARGQFSVVWVLGTRASDAQGLTAQVAEGKHKATLTVSAVAKPIEVSSIAFAAHTDTTMVKLGVATRMPAEATDPFGNRFVPAAMKFASLDTSLCSVDSFGTVQARKRGLGRVVVLAGSAADTAWVHPTQVVQTIVASPDTLRFHSLGQVANLTVQLLDDQGLAVKDSLPVDSVAVDTVVKVQPGTTYAVRSISNGMTPVVLRAGVVAQTVQVVVNQKVASVKVSASHSNFDALGDTARLSVLVSDSLGAPLTNQVLAYSASDSSVANVGPTGLVTSRGNGSTWIRARAYNGVADSVAIGVAQQIARVVVKRDSIMFDALHAVLPIQAAAIDRLGSVVAGAGLTYATGSPSVVTVDQNGNLQALANGATVAIANYGADTATVVVRVSQRPVRVVMSSDTVRFVALGETQALQAVAVDSLAYPVSSVVHGLTVSDTTVVQQIDTVTIRSRANGVTQATFSVASISIQVVVVVSQVPTRISATSGFGKPIVTLPVGSPVPLTCQVFDRNGYLAPGDPNLSGTMTGTVTGAGCATLRVQRSGNDTITLSLGAAVARIPLTVAAAPIVSSPLGTFISIDSFPTEGSAAWSPTLLKDPAGTLELYFTVYSSKPDSTGFTRGNLYRAISTDGINYQLQGVALAHADSICNPQGQGIENVAIIPRSDGPGWRMFYAAGSNACYGWEVFSAVSTDRVAWSKESGVRLSNGNIGPKGAPPYPPYPVGEGMWVDQLPSGEWRMIVGTQEHVQPPNNTWQIAEWTSPDQLSWTYQGTVLTTRQMPASGQGAVYSPSIRQLAPGLWRMLFTADNRGTPGSVSQVWSAVSTDLENWQVEGPALGAPGTNLYYASLVDDRLVFIRQDGSGSLSIATATVAMP
ncbi:MAG TPA: hypothetical protein VNH14_07820 [Gemmatimonadales bacterium]|nr:hypothetical protein [Gemmatimonadales bacterium]